MEKGVKFNKTTHYYNYALQNNKTAKLPCRIE